MYGTEAKYVKRSVEPAPSKNRPFIKNITEVKIEKTIEASKVIVFPP
jgi:hypothetical protein